uniref:Uncharacterized protein n=1 Tax=viral metagenome TaxID=1070528 RepID=A0A6H1ZHH0_9ZZZZ
MKLKLKYKLDNSLSETKAILTDEHPASSYGIPVLVSLDGKTAWGPGDGNDVITARKLVTSWMLQNPKDLAGIEFCQKFLQIK